jgi:hypothetical protein
MSPYKKRDVPSAQLVRTSFGFQGRALSMANVVGRRTVGQFTAGLVGFVGLIAVVATQLS